MEIDKQDLKFLKEEYAMSQYELLTNDALELENMANFYRGQKRGLEMALVRLGVSNDECDKICSEQYERCIREGVIVNK